MPLLSDYVITPEVLDIASYSSEEMCGVHVRRISEVMRHEGLVRDLRSGDWSKLFAPGGRSWHRWGQELVRKLATQGRLIRFKPERDDAPRDDRGWCEEALLTAGTQAFTGGIVTTEPIKEEYRSEPRVERVDQLYKASWWSGRSPTVRLSRTSDDYTEKLGPVLRSANSLQFIDPYLDPARRSYNQFRDLLAVAGRRTPPPSVEIHCVCTEGSGPDRRPPNVEKLEKRFRRELVPRLESVGLRVDVYIWWPGFHDRYLISNLIGISMQNGFDTTTDVNDKTTWSRMGRDDRDDVQREFDPAKRGVPHGKFRIP